MGLSQLDETRPIIEPQRPPRHLQVFVNRNLRLDQIRAIGFDMDYTLARYRRERIEERAYRLTIDKLIERGYPEAVRDLAYDARFVIRGLTVDKQLGNILKLDRHNHVGRVYHGRRALTKEERRELYRREKIRYAPPRFAMVDTLFSLPETCLYANMIDYLEKIEGFSLDTWKLFEDTRECIDAAHADDTLKSVVKADLGQFIERDPLLARTLHKLRSSGKKLFLLTNSYWDYTDTLMKFMLDGELPEYASWQSYFELIVVGSRKPAFFTERQPFFAVGAGGRVRDKPAEQLERGTAYQGGNLASLEASLGVSGEEVLYVGDHIFGDILRSKKASLWRTALIVEEIEDEILRFERGRDDVARLEELEVRRRDLDERANLQRQYLSALEQAMGSERARASTGFDTVRLERDATKRELKTVLAEMEERETSLERAANPYWGRVFKETGENSRFGEQVTDYACVYTSRVSNFLGYSSHQYFRSPRDLMPHERP